MNVTGKQIGIGAACLLALSTAAGAVANMKTLGIDGLLPASRDYVMEVAEDNNRRWLREYKADLFALELEEQEALKNSTDVNQTLKLYNAHKNGFKEKIQTLEKKLKESE
jgi:hypothetical protein